MTFQPENYSLELKPCLKPCNLSARKPEMLELRWAVTLFKDPLTVRSVLLKLVTK